MRQLMILEVSQKQAYIFASTRLRDNIANSEAICQVTDPGYFKLAAEAEGKDFDVERRLVYSGGGHTVLEFDSEEAAKDFAWLITRRVKGEFPEIELFVRVIPYDESKLPGENLKRLSEELEVKKSLRAAAFGQRTFGVERIMADTRKSQTAVEGVKALPWSRGEERRGDYTYPCQFNDLGNSENESSFIAVIHIDGNAMGKRVEELRRRLSREGMGWEDYKKSLRRFSDAIDRDFKAAFREMEDQILSEANKPALEKLKLKPQMIPLRKIILAGDDVCFVTEGRIGLEAARIFMEKLSARKNSEDGKGYAACAGVAIVHQKYPFYKAYELAEGLCSNAKKYLAGFSGEDPEVNTHACSIDWHIEYGSTVDSLEGVREEYEALDKTRLELRPYLIEKATAAKVLDMEKTRRYGNFRRLILYLDSDRLAYARGKIKGLREAIREGETASKYYMKVRLLEDFAAAGHMREEEAQLDADTLAGLFSGKPDTRMLCADTRDGKRRSLYFDAIELLDTFIGLE